MSASSPVRVIGSSALRATMARTMARARFSSPSVAMMAARSRSGSVVDEVACGRAFGAHAHVERAVLVEGEAALGLVELHGGDAEVEGNPVDRGDAFAFGDLAHLGITAEDEFQASGEVRFEHLSA